VGAHRSGFSGWADIDQAIAEGESAAERIPPSYRHTLLADGAIIRAQLVDVQAGRVGSRTKWFAIFEISEDDDQVEARRLPILRGYNAPREGWLSPQHALAVDYVTVTGLRLYPMPKETNRDLEYAKYLRRETRRARLVLGSFLKDVQIEAHTHVVNRQMDAGAGTWIQTPEINWYSTIDRILRCTAGCPRILQQRKRRT
jgi:hypothetical protein